MKENKNNLIYEKSPYLLQHKDNPIHWYSWSEEAFIKAKQENKPIFLSIGYSTCHWCHVMADESFEDIEVAQFLNENFISIKVDREERPDIDNVYMEVCVNINGSGGWPLSVFIDSDKKPFYAGTYFPKDYFLRLLKEIKKIWDNEFDQISKTSNMHLEKLKLNLTPVDELSSKVINKYYSMYLREFDYKYGGTKGSPKFPMPHSLLFLLYYSRVFANKEVLSYCFKTLDSLRMGGIYDQIGFGFSRYSTDEKWLVPHFEKMLYDNALLMSIYCLAYQASNKEIYKNTAKEIAYYLTTQMQDELGGFYTAEDADSEGSEGVFYIFTKAEIEEVLENNASEFIEYYNVTNYGNFEGKNVLNLIGKDFSKIERLNSSREKLYKYRNLRPRPFLDKKILLSNNALVISGFINLYKITKDNEYLNKALNVYRFINNYMVKDSKLMATYIDGNSSTYAFLEDYAYYINSLIDLHQITFEEKYIIAAKRHLDYVIKNFYDVDNGGFYQSDIESEIVLHRQKEIHDGAKPSSNSVMIYNLLRLSEIYNDITYFKIAKKTLKLFYNLVDEYPLGYAFYNYSLLAYKKGFVTIRLIGKREDFNRYLELIERISNLFLVTIIEAPSDHYPLLDNLPTTYVCFNKECKRPTNTFEDFQESLKDIL